MKLCEVCGHPFTTLSGPSEGCPVHGIRGHINSESVPELLETLRMIVYAINVKELDPIVVFAAIEKARYVIKRAKGS